MWPATASAADFNPSAAPSSIELKSPDGRLVVTFSVRDLDGVTNCPTYTVACEGKIVVAPSRLGLVLEGAALDEGFQIAGVQTKSQDMTWRPVCGERSTIRDHFNQLTVHLQQTSRAACRLVLTFRAYDSGVVFGYTVPKQAALEQARLAQERTEFRFTANHDAWAVYSAQGAYAKVPLSQIKPGCERPLVVRVADDCYVALAEAKLVDYARMKFGPLTGVSNSLVSVLAGPVTAALPLTTPWRVIMVAESPGRLLENDDLILNLNDLCAIADTSWIKPGKVIREVTLTTAGAKACVDFAVQRGLQFVEFDAGWYGPENSDKSDARAVNIDPARSKGPLDLPEVISYAAEHGIGVLLYVNHRALERQLDEILPLYRRWGVKGVKYGFVNVGSQQWTRWLHEAVRKAATNQLMVDIHDEYRPTGYQRTYPNLMTMEGVRGDEETPPPAQELTTLFTRMLAGPADHTVCYFDGRVDRAWTHGFQLAKAVCLVSPWQFLYWYDRPPNSPANIGGAGGAEPRVSEAPELEFYNALPTVWDDTRVIHGNIGQYAVVARRKGDQWFIGGMNASETRTLEVPLKFLPAGQSYTAHIYSDDPDAPTKTKVRIEKRPVDSASRLAFAMSAQGGQAVHLVPASAKR